MDSRRQPTSLSIDSRFSALFERHYDEVLRYCIRRIDRTGAEDAASEVFVVAWRRIDDLDWIRRDRGSTALRVVCWPTALDLCGDETGLPARCQVLPVSPVTLQS